ncbi:MAG: NTP transferase domain-containing protein [Acidimicrobiales bacterium]
MTDVPHSTTFVLLAAGAGSRFAGPVHKLLAPVGHLPVVTRAVRAMVATGGDSCVVVTGADTSVDFLAALEGVRTVHNDAWESGQRSSVLLAITTARREGSSQVVIGLADQPFVAPGAWAAVAGADAAVAVATYAGRRGNPVKLRADAWEEFAVLDADPDSGARVLMVRRPELVVEVACEGSPDDIDTREDLTRWT